MDWPPQSPELNPIEQLWDYLDTLLRSTPQTSQAATFKMLNRHWSNISQGVLKTYVHSMPRRCKAVMKLEWTHQVLTC